MKRLEKWYKKLRALLIISWYTVFYYKKDIKENWVLLDSKNGKDLGSNLLRIAEELMNNPEYRSYRIFISCNKEKREEIQKMAERYGLQRAKFIAEGRFHYAKAIALAKYLFTDTSFPAWYAKKEGQVITNTWHGTPLKMMGKDVEDRSYDMGNVQKNYLIADYLVYPSDYMRDVMVSAYFLKNLYQGKILCSGYPRNSVFFDEKRREEMRKELGFEKKKVYGYMPTWRGNLKNIDSEKNTDQLEYFFMLLDREFNEDEIFYVRLHPFIGDKINYASYKHIRPFPEGYEPYDILNACDCMVTDYSSVMFDYANTGRKIVLFVYDYEFYMDERGAYVAMSKFPFPKVRTVKALVEELRRPKEYKDEDFRQKFCQYDGSEVAKRLCRHIIGGQKEFEEFDSHYNGKENVLIYSGSLAKNGITTALLNLLENLDTQKRNYFITFRSGYLRKEPERIKMLPKGVGFLPIPNVRQYSYGESKAIQKYFEENDGRPSVLRKVDRFYQRLYQRNFGHCHFDWVLHFHGYEKEVINMFLHAPARRAIFVHNDMISEIRTKGNQHEPTLRRAYHDYDKVVPVTEDIYGFTLELGQNSANLQVVNNCHDWKSVLRKSEQKLEFEKNTLCNVFLSDLEEILNSDARKIITIGRFSAEKGHAMLLRAFDRYHKENPNSYLIIIGGYGALYEQTLVLANSLPSARHIVIIRSIANPMPILKRCDLFVLASFYEALGLVLLEADTLGVPVISTDIPGPKGFMEEHGGMLVSVDEQGIYEGIKAFDRGEVKAMCVDYEKYNENAVEQFEKLLEGEA